MGHDIIQQPVWLRVELIEYDTVNIQAVLCIRFRRQHLIEAVERCVHQTLLRQNRLDTLFQRGALLHHLACYIKHNRCLLPICCTAVYFRAPFTVSGQQIKGDCCREFALTLFFGYFNIGRIVLPISVFFDCPENISHDLLLPRQQCEVLAMPFALRML